MSAQTTVRSQGPARLWVLRRWAIAEVLVFLTLALLVDTRLGDGTRFIAVSPHPFWAIVIIVAAQYGTAEGLFAWAAATATLLIGHLPPHSVGDNLQSWLSAVVSLPAWWLGTALALGALTDRHRAAILRCERELIDACERESTLVTALERLTEIKDSLETAIAGELQTASAVVAGARAITHLDTSQVVLGVGQLVSAILGPEKFSVFLLKGTELHAVLKVGWVRQEHWLRRFGADTNLFGAIVGRRQTLAVARAADEIVLDRQGVLAGPLIAAETGEVFGMLKIEQLRFTGLTPATLHTFKILCEWIGESYRNARQHEETVQAPARPYVGTSLEPYIETGVFKADP